MNILIINQPTNNRGDEAAHRSLLRALVNYNKFNSLTVLFIGEDAKGINEIKVQNDKIQYINIPLHRGFYRIARFALRFNIEYLLSIFHPQVRKVKKHISKADIVLNAPGGICMGLFQNWKHILWLRLAQKAGKRIAYYSRSFGPFPESTNYNKVFKKVSLNLLKYFQFLSIRDLKTMKLASDLNLEYISSIDTAFLDEPKVDIPYNIKDSIGSDDYIVLVPNSLTWHPAYRTANQTLIENFYIAIINFLLIKYSSSKIVLLPQLFNRGPNGDMEYFNNLKEKSQSQRVIVLSDEYSSDIQQKIISKSKFVIGARYHSVVFAINNGIPFVALSYEHKIAGLLTILNLGNSMVDISDLGKSEFDINIYISSIEIILDQKQNIKDAKLKANSIAQDCFKSLILFFEHD